MIDDQAEFLAPLNLVLTHLGVNANMVFDGFAARRAIRERNYDLVIIDWMMPDLNGGECLSFTDTTLFLDGRPRYPMPVIVYSGLDRSEIHLPAMQFFRPVAHWKKPMSLAAMTRSLISILETME